MPKVLIKINKEQESLMPAWTNHRDHIKYDVDLAGSNPEARIIPEELSID